MTNDTSFQNGYADINGLHMYYEIHGEGTLPLVLIHGGGSTIQTTFGSIIPHLAKHRKIIAMELQAHGRTGDRDTPLSFEQDADDIAGLLQHLNISKADFLGYSNGGQTLIALSLRFPGLVNKMIICSAFYKRNAAPSRFWEGFQHVKLEMMPEALRKGFLAVNHDEAALQKSFDRDVQRMQNFESWSDVQIQSIHIPTLIVNGNKDVGSIEHAVEMYRTLPDAQLLVLPGEHGAYLGAVEGLNGKAWEGQYFVQLVEIFLGK